MVRIRSPVIQGRLSGRRLKVPEEDSLRQGKRVVKRREVRGRRLRWGSGKWLLRMTSKKPEAERGGSGEAGVLKG